MSESGRFQVNITLNEMKNGKGRTARTGESGFESAAVNLLSGIVFLIQSVAVRSAILSQKTLEFLKIFSKFSTLICM